MKKIFVLLLSIAMLFTMVACKKEETPANVSTVVTDPTTGITENTETTETTNPETPDKPVISDYETDVTVGLLLNGNDVVYDEENIKITLTECSVDSPYIDMNFDIQNSSDKKIVFGCGYVNINGMTSTCMNPLDVVDANATLTTSIRASNDYVSEVCETPEDVEYCEISFFILECAEEGYENYTGVIVENGVAIFKSENYVKENYVRVNHGELVYEDDVVSVYIKKDCDRNKFYEDFQYTMVNKTGRPIILSLDSVESTSDLNEWYTKTSMIVNGLQIIAPNSYASSVFTIANSKLEHILSAKFVLGGYENTGIMYVYSGIEAKKLPTAGNVFEMTFPRDC